MRSFYKFVSTYLADTAMVISPIIFWLAVLVLGSHFPQYSWFRYSISTLAYAPYGWIIVTVFWLSGFTLMLMALRLGRIAGKGNIYKIGVTLILLSGIGFVVIAIIPTQAHEALNSVKGLIHFHTANTIAVLFPVSCFCIAAGLRNKPAMQLFRTLTLFCGAIGVISVIIGIGAIFIDAIWFGAIERLIIGDGLLWVEITGIYFVYQQIRK